MGKVVVDSSVLIAMSDGSDSLHEAAKEALRERISKERVVPAVVFSEVMVRAFKVGERTAERVEVMIDQFASEVRPIDREIAFAAAQIRARRSALRLPDALVLATGQVLGAEVLTADKAWRGEPGHVTVIEPK